MSFKFERRPSDDLESELPADFAALGEQLQADAARLGSVYPACRPPLELIDALAVKSRRWWLRPQVAIALSSAAALLLVALTITLVVSRGSLIESASTEPATNIAPVVEPAPFDVVHSPFPAPPVPIANDQPVPVSYRPAVVEFNGPELEGLLDLWQEQPQAAATIAF